MNHQRAQNYFRLAWRGSREVSVPFVTPIFSVMAGAATASGGNQAVNTASFRFVDSARDYARTNGLSEVLDGNYGFPTTSGLQGKTYTKLTRLSTSDEVEACNAIINDLIHNQLGGHAKNTVSRLCQVVGELHDNVASHARGCGFSCAQVYSLRSKQEVEFAIADCGCGMLRNVRSVNQEVTNDVDSIAWCLQDGNTTARGFDDWAQRLPEDAVCNPYPSLVPLRSSENHHMGRGLGHLVRLVKETRGALWIKSGKGEYLLTPESELCRFAGVDWQGVAIEFSIPIVREEQVQAADSQLDELARRLGI